VRVAIDPTSYLPVSVQLREQLKQQIRRGALEPGAKLPAVRELAGFLRVNRNTVLRALRELERDGYVRGHQGKGVFVTDNPGLTEDAAGLEALVDETIARAVARRVDPEALALALLTKPWQRASRSRARIVLVECNRPNLRLYRRNLQEELQVDVDTCLLSELAGRAHELRFLSEYSLAVTTFFHVEEVEALLDDTRIPVIALLPEASLNTLMRLIQLPPGTRVGVVCEDSEGTDNLEQSLDKAGLIRIKLRKARIDDPKGLAKVLEGCAVLVTSRDCASRLAALAPEHEIVVEDGGLDRAGIALVREYLNTTAQGGLTALPGGEE